jgi:formylglycine-generating enzyme required for sulfatase activity
MSRKMLAVILGAILTTAVVASAQGPPQGQGKAGGAPRAGDTRVNPKDGLTYVYAPAGKFKMGCSPGDSECIPNEMPAHEVTITKGFWIGQTEVTQEAYQKVTGKNPSYLKGAKLPVETIIWNDAQSYCRMAGMRLPTEAEWEYAARAGSSASRYGNLDQIAWYDGNSGNRTHEVGQKQANAWGLYDTLGNVWEWVADWYANSYPAGNQTDPRGPTRGQYRVVRGGSKMANLVRGGSMANLVRVSSVGGALLVTGPDVGVRCVGKLP